MASGQAYGFATPEDWGSEFSAIRFVIMRSLARWRTCTLVQVTAVQPGAVGPIGTVTVQPLVNMVDGQGTATPHGTFQNIPYLRISGGKNAVICDPAVNDIGVMVVSDRDISSVKNAQQPSPPGSERRADLADGIYLGTIISQEAPTQYVQFTATGINIVDVNGNKIQLTATGINISDINSNQIQMKPGSVNIVTEVLQVNGVPVTVP
jgi:hypothetical protein